MQPEITIKPCIWESWFSPLVLLKFNTEFKKSEAASKFRNTGIQYFAIHYDYI